MQQLLKPKQLPYVLGKYFVRHNMKLIMVVLPDITLIQAFFFDIRMKDRIEVELNFAH